MFSNEEILLFSSQVTFSLTSLVSLKCLKTCRHAILHITVTHDTCVWPEVHATISLQLKRVYYTFLHVSQAFFSVNLKRNPEIKQ